MRLYFLIGLLLVNSCCRVNAESGAGADTVKPRVETLEDLDAVEQRVESLETSLEDFEKKVENRLEYGGKRYQTVVYNSELLRTYIRVRAIIHSYAYIVMNL